MDYSGNQGMVSTETIAECPDYYPERIVVPEGRILFCRMSPDAYRNTPFLDHRIIRAGVEQFAIPFSGVGEIVGRATEHRTHYIFHNAFCCSTVLTRYLDALTGPLVLREPNALYEVLTQKRFEGTYLVPRLRGVDWETLYRFICLMIGRRYQPDMPTIIKPTDGCNFMMRDLAGRHAGNRALFIYSSIERFIVSVIRYGPRCEWVKIRARELLRDVFLRTGLMPVQLSSLPVSQIAALVWILHTEEYITSIQEWGGKGFASVNAEQLLTDPVATLVMICQYFLLPYKEAEIRGIMVNARVDENAKAAHERFDPEQRRQDYAATRASYESVIREALDWAAEIRPGRDIFAPLPGQLVCSQQ